MSAAIDALAATLLQALMPHLIVAPIVLPMVCASVLLMFRERAHRSKAALALVAVFANAIVALLLLRWAMQGTGVQAYGVYLPANWDVPFGIVLVLDRLSALMLVLTAFVATMALVFSIVRWHRAGPHFHVLFLLQVMGLNGAFLTADLFNLFVFFEVMLAASYGLLLHGTGPARVKAGLHYLSVNLAASSLFLIGVAMIYGVAGTLNMADLAAKIAYVAAADRPLLHAGCAILAVAFLVKAAMWPLNFWLAPAYASASAPSSAIFAMLTKVGVYVLLRLSTLLFSPTAGESAGFGADWLLWGGLATLAFGAIGMLASQRPSRLASYGVIVSSGTLLAVLGFARADVTAAALYYLPASTLALAAFFLIAELMDRSRSPDPEARRAPEDEEDHLPFSLADQELNDDVNLDEEEVALIGRAIPASTAQLGLAFMACTLLVAGLPPLAGFVGKVAMLSALLSDSAADVSPAAWVVTAAVVLSGLFALVALSRAGIRFFWTPVDRAAPVLHVFEFLPILVLLVACVAYTVRAEPVLRYAAETSANLYEPRPYVDAVMSARPLPTPTNADRLGAVVPGGLR